MGLHICVSAEHTGVAANPVLYPDWGIGLFRRMTRKYEAEEIYSILSQYLHNIYDHLSVLFDAM
jgi:hypothetical protein